MSPLEIENNLKYHLDILLPHHEISEVYNYALFPAGKLFRPILVWSILEDIDPLLFKTSIKLKNSNHSLLSSAVEFHHAYSLIHDDLPCMDDDQMRRGKACTHIAFSEWKALLAGDGLINLSYQLLSKVKHPRAMEVLAFFSWAMGPKGLILGQVLDLSFEMTANLSSIIRIHELKTARLIQAAILGSAMLTLNNQSLNPKKLWRFSKCLGVNFQLIDDLSELAEKNLSQHEKTINPWINNSIETANETIKSLTTFNLLASELKLFKTNQVIKEYYLKMIDHLSTNQENILAHLNHKIDLFPIIFLMKSFS